MEDKQILGLLMIAQLCSDKRKAVLAILLDEIPSYIIDQQPPGLPGIKRLLEKTYLETCEKYPEFLPYLLPMFSIAFRQPLSNKSIDWKSFQNTVAIKLLYPNQEPPAQESQENTEELAMDKYQKEADSPPTDYHDIGGSD